MDVGRGSLGTPSVTSSGSGAGSGGSSFSEVMGSGRGDATGGSTGAVGGAAQSGQAGAAIASKVRMVASGSAMKSDAGMGSTIEGPGGQQGHLTVSSVVAVAGSLRTSSSATGSAAASSGGGSGNGATSQSQSASTVRTSFAPVSSRQR